jgi:inorganic pyrophosphatase
VVQRLRGLASLVHTHGAREDAPSKTDTRDRGCGDRFSRVKRAACRHLPVKSTGLRRSAIDVRASAVQTDKARDRALEELLNLMFTPHPIHGIEAGEAANVTAYIEITPGTTVKNEVWKKAGRLGIDRPQPYSSACPALYGLVPRTDCGARVAAECMQATGKKDVVGDGDPIDILVLTDNVPVEGDLLAHARVIGGLRMIDGDEADDKLIAVLIKDATYGHLKDIEQLAAAMPGLIDKMKHYFLTYKQGPGEVVNRVEIAETYGADVAARVLEASKQDYVDRFGDPKDRVSHLRRLILGTD